MKTVSEHGIVYTNDNCIGCNKCINVCSAIGACISKEENGRARIEVDGSKCVACGSCIDVCVHGAREFEDDTERFFDDLKKGEKISLLLAPAFKANYPDEYESILGALKDLGINRIISVSFGADICTWGYLNYIDKYDFTGGISQPCPAAVSYIERYLPELIPNLFPVQSPLMCAAIYARKEMGLTDRFAFISPCIAKKIEMEDPHNEGLVQYNVTFDHLLRYIKDHNIKGSKAKSEIEYGLGSFYPTPGGLAETVRWFLGDSVFIRQIEGERRLYEWMHTNADRIKNHETPFLFIDALNCEKGCICGTAVDTEKSRTDDALYALLDIREQSKKNVSGDAWSRPDTPEERLKNFNEQFSALKLEDYLRGYTDLSAQCRYEIPSEEDLDKIFESMNKTTPETRSINCTCCGYESCTQMATAIYNGFNHKENCIFYEKTMVHELEVEKAIAEESARAKSAFLANMSHEIRTPINAILGMNEMVLRECDDAGITAYSESIKSAGRTLLGLVNNILDFSKIESGKVEINPVDYYPSSLINDLVNMVRLRAEEKKLNVVVDIDSEIPSCIYGDELRVKQVITNLLTNAVKFTEKGRISFKVGYDKIPNDANHILLNVSVEDTGIGIKEEDLNKLFSMFERIELERNRNVEGTGIGMNITKLLLEMMGSELQIKSRYGEGSTFYFSLRQKVVSWEPLGNMADKYRNSQNSRNDQGRHFTAPDIHVLVVDDNQMNIMVFKSLVKQTKIVVDSAESGDEAVMLTGHRKYDLIFMDHMMPEKDGIETMHEIKSQSGNPNKDTPMVCLTANAVSGAKQMYIEAGFEDYLAKPVDSVKLEDMMLIYLPPDLIEWSDSTEEEDLTGGIMPKEIELLSTHPEIDTASALQISGSPDAFMPLLKVFNDTINSRIDEIVSFYEENNIKDYTIKVHAFKSSARLVGANDLADKAQLLEDAGKSTDMDYINKNHGDFINDCRHIRDIFKSIFIEEEPDDSGKQEASDSLLGKVYQEIKKAAENMDCMHLEAVITRMEKFRIPDSDKEKWKKICAASDEFDYESILDILQ